MTLAACLLEKRFQGCDRTHIFEFDTSMTETALRGIEVGPHQTLRAILVATLSSDVYLTGPARFDVMQLLDGRLTGGSTFQFGYDLPKPGTVLICRRIRITADLLEWGDGDDCRHHHGTCLKLLAVRVILGGDPNRTYSRIVPDLGHDHKGEHEQSSDGDHSSREAKDIILFDGMIQEGDSMSLTVFAIHCHRNGRSEDQIYERLFDGTEGIRSWLGEYEGEGKEHLRLEYGVDEIQMGAGSGDTD